MARSFNLCFILLLLTGCVSAGFRTPDYVADLDRLVIANSGPLPNGPPGSSARQAEIRQLIAKPQLGLVDLMRIADLSNPEIGAARNEVGAAAGRAWQAELHPNPILALEAEDVPIRSVGLSRSQNTLSVTQPIIVGGRRSAAISAATAKREARILTLAQKRREVLGEVRLVYFELLYVRQAIALHAALLEIGRETLRIATTRFEARAAPELEVIKPQVEVHELELGKRRLERQREAAAARLCAVLGGLAVPMDRLHGELPESLPDLDLARLQRPLREGHPGILAAQKEIEAADRLIRQAEAERIGDVGLRIAYGRNAFTDENTIEAGISIPLPIFNRNQGRIFEAKHLAAGARRSAETLAHRLVAELAVAHAAYMAARDEVAVFRDRIVPASEKALSQARAGYQAGKMRLLDLLDAQRTLSRARLSLLGSIKDASRARARIWQILGPSTEN